jgi:hypothetical protein
MKYNIEGYQDSKIPKVVDRWNLDSPQAGSQMEDQGLLLGGWAIAAEGSQFRLHFVLRFQDGTFSYPMNTERHDVIRSVLQREPDQMGGLMFGFNLHLDPNQLRESFRLGFETDGLIQWVATISTIHG